MGYRSLQECVRDLERTRQLITIEQEIDPYLEAAEIQRRVYQAQGPAVLYARVRGCRFPMVSNLFGTLPRTRFLFRDTLPAVQKLVELKTDPERLARRPLRYLGIPWTLLSMRPRVVRRGPVLQHETSVGQLPQVTSWPRDGGPFITLPIVYSEDPDRPGFSRSNLGMYRVQLSGNRYEPEREVGLHYQIHRGIGVHHAAALRRRAAAAARGETAAPFRVNVCVGGPPALTMAAVMPLPEGLSELAFAGALGGRAVRMIRRREGLFQASDGLPFDLPVCADADFCICGTVVPDRLLPEGPFGDHLGYYSLQHDFPVLRVEKVYHRAGAIWPFTTVGRPPQEDTSFGAFIHELTGPIIPAVIPGVHGVHAVDAAGVHPLLLAIGSERYTPYDTRRAPQELLTQANAILGQGQLSLAKYLWIVDRDDDPALDLHDVAAFFQHTLRRVDWSRDLHFQTCTTIDTLDYSGQALNSGSKLVVAAAGPPRRALSVELPLGLAWPTGFSDPRIVFPGVMTLSGPREEAAAPQRLAQFLEAAVRADGAAWSGWPLIVLVDDSEFASRNLRNWLWVTFTRSNPAVDIFGVGEFVEHKHWGCRGPLIIDARTKPHHAPPLVEDPAVTRRVDALAAPGGPLHGVI